MKISEMNRQELKEYINNSAEKTHLDHDSRAWKRAFELFRESGGGSSITMDCPKCWQKVTEWISK